MNNSPLISIIIPVYNAEKTLSRCIDSLVYQTFDNYEVLIVEKSSTDRSLEIAELYACQFPDKVRVIKEEYTYNSARGINVGVKNAKGDYLCFCDPDDFFELDAMHIISKNIIQNPCDMTFCNAKVLNEKGKLLRISKISLPLSKTTLLTNMDLMTYWRLCIKRVFFLEQGSVPENCLFADVSWVPLFIDKAKTIGNISKPVYNYFFQAGVTKLSDISQTKFLDVLNAFDRLIENVSDENKDAMIMFVATRLYCQLRKYAVSETFAEWLAQRNELFLENKFVKNDKRLYSQFCKSLNRLDRKKIPKIIYINGFDGISEERIEYLKNNSFANGDCKVVVLNNDNCDIKELPYAEKVLQSNNKEYIVHYFALKNIYLNGGFYIGESIKFVNPLNCMRYYEAIFSYLDDSKLTHEIYGACANNDAIGNILKTYKTPKCYENTIFNLADRIKVILSALYDFDIDGKTCVKKGICIKDPSVFVLPINFGIRISYIDFSTSNLSERVMVPIEVLNFILKAYNPNTGYEINKIQLENNSLRRELNDINNSDSYKLVKHLKKFGNTKVGGFFKKIFKWFLKKYRHVKYGM